MFLRNTIPGAQATRAQSLLLPLAVVGALACGLYGCGGGSSTAKTGTSTNTGSTGTSAGSTGTSGGSSTGGTTTPVNSDIQGTYSITFSGSGTTQPSKGSFSVRLVTASVGKPLYSAATIDNFTLNTPALTLTPDYSNGLLPFTYTDATSTSAGGVSSAFAFKDGSVMNLITKQGLGGNPLSVTGTYNLLIGNTGYAGNFTMTKTAN